jgi:hypothetical protein
MTTLAGSIPCKQASDTRDGSDAPLLRTHGCLARSVHRRQDLRVARFEQRASVGVGEHGRCVGLRSVAHSLAGVRLVTYVRRPCRRRRHRAVSSAIRVRATRGLRATPGGVGVGYTGPYYCLVASFGVLTQKKRGEGWPTTLGSSAPPAIWQRIWRVSVGRRPSRRRPSRDTYSMFLSPMCECVRSENE